MLPGTLAYDALDAYGVAIEGGFDHFEDVNDPKAYLNILLFDKNFNFVDAAYRQLDIAKIQVDPVVKAPHDYLEREVTVTEPGFAFIFFSNEDVGRIDVHFDDVTITHTHSRIVAGADYYPYGLAMEGREIDDEPYRWGYQGQFSEKDETTGYNEFDLRFYDAKIARWLTTDRYGQYYSPYVAMGNVPHMSVDPDGGFAFNFGRAVAYAGLGATFGGIVDLVNGGDGTKGALIGFAAGFAGGGVNWSSLKMPNISLPKASGSVIASAGRSLLNYELQQQNGAQLFKNETKAYNYIWDNSFQDIPYGFKVPWRENHAWITNKGVLVLPTEGWKVDSEGNRMDYFINTAAEGETAALRVKDGYVYFNNMKLKILASIHTHPEDFDGASGVFDKDATHTKYGPVFVITHKKVIVGFKKGGVLYNNVFSTKNQLLKGGWSIYQNLPLFPK